MNIKFLVFSLLFFSIQSWSQTILFSEDFEGENIGDVVGTSTEGIGWTAVCDSCVVGDIFEVDDAFGTMKGLRGNDTNGPAIMTATGIDATGMHILILEFDYESTGYSGSGNLECHTECSGCSGNPADVLLGGCNTCWDFLLWELSTGTFTDGNIVLGNDCSVPDNGSVISNPGCSSPYDINGNLIPGNDPANLTLTISMAMWASTENMTIDNIVLTGYTKAEAIANGLISNPGTGGTISVCGTGSTNLFDVLTNSPDNTGFWSGPSTTTGGYLGTIDLATAAAGDYYYIVSTGSGCEDTATVIATGGAIPTVNISILSGNDSICLNETTTLEASGVGNYMWSTGQTTTTIDVISPPQTISVTSTNACGTSLPASIDIISLGDVPVVSFSGDTVICNGNITTLTGAGGDNYLWTGGSTLTTYSTDQTGMISLTAFNVCGSNTISINIIALSVEAYFQATPSTGMEPLYVVFTDSSINAISYEWDFGNGETSTNQNPSTTYLTDGIYTIVLTSSNSTCSDIATFTIVVDDMPFEIPNVFSPNGDAQNDVFMINPSIAKEIKGTILNRWGQVLFEWDDINIGWDGKSDGKESPEGTYNYIMELTLITDEVKTFSGSFSLFR